MKVTDDSKRIRVTEPKFIFPVRYYLTRSFRAKAHVQKNLSRIFTKHGISEPTLMRSANKPIHYLTFLTDTPEQAGAFLRDVAANYDEFVTIRRCIIDRDEYGHPVLKDLGEYEAATRSGKPVEAKTGVRTGSA